MPQQPRHVADRLRSYRALGREAQSDRVRTSREGEEPAGRELAGSLPAVHAMRMPQPPRGRDTDVGRALDILALGKPRIMPLLLVDDRDGRVLDVIETQEDVLRLLESFVSPDRALPDGVALVEVGSHHRALLGTDTSVAIRPLSP